MAQREGVELRGLRKPDLTIHMIRQLAWVNPNKPGGEWCKIAADK